MGEWGGLRLKRRLRCGLSSRLLEWHPRTSPRAQCGMNQNLMSRLARAAHVLIDQ